MSRILVVTAVDAERDAVLAGRAGAVGTVEGRTAHRVATAAGLVDVVVAGVGPVAAAVTTAWALRRPYDLVVSAGIAGGFAPVLPGDVVVADAVVHADLGAQTGDDGFTSMAELGWGQVRYDIDAALVGELARRCQARTGAILTVSTTTGTRRRADRLTADHPDAVAEAMEGVGVLLAARQAGVRFAEVRAVSNLVGARDRDSWQIGPALDSLGRAFDAIGATELPAKAASC